MLRAKEDLERYLEKEILKVTHDTETCKQICNYAQKVYDLPRAITSDYISLRNPLSEAGEFILFCILDSLEKVQENKKSYIGEYFVEKEIKTYSTSKYKVDKIKFPLRFKAIQIAEDQWMSSIDFKMLMKLRAAQLIVYNENTQRIMKRIVRGDKEIYKIEINHAAVHAIENLYKEGTYIPTPFTINIPLDSEYDFYYDESTCELVIKSLECFDIVDGYHRYIAACKACDSDKNINYTMELRIINFPEDKAQQFIYQEDQKTVMKKSESNTFDHTSLANRIVERLNTSPQSNLNGLITRNQTLINYGDLSDLIKYFFLNNTTKENKNSLFLSVANELIEKFNMITEYNPKYIEKKYSYKQLFAIMYCFNYFKNQDKSNMCRVIDEVIKMLDNVDNSKFKNKDAKKMMINEVDVLLREVL